MYFPQGSRYWQGNVMWPRGLWTNVTLIRPRDFHDWACANTNTLLSFTGLGTRRNIGIRYLILKLFSMTSSNDSAIYLPNSTLTILLYIKYHYNIIILCTKRLRSPSFRRTYTYRIVGMFHVIATCKRTCLVLYNATIRIYEAKKVHKN